MEHLEDILVAPLVSEESWRLQEDNMYTFKVHPEASKSQIKQAVEEIFKVRVVAVRTMNMPGKPRKQRFYQRGRTPRWKKAVVRLAEGNRIDIYQ
ncbi:MAG: 50S ribosomal protein L23 [Candidatus Acetothermia bacterium]|jgi:large subunit ribosomal protein L23|nr:50S ribosomal protein L23 [Candidatus Acetothermia bacterium]MDH7505551.1 50S ribosomal protein L23 [Candidatus Acetothermia bacterium]